MAQIAIKNLTFQYSGTQKAAIRNISLEIEQGDFVVICGESGCGKSTLLRSLKPAIRPFGESKGQVLYENQPVDNLPDRTQAEQIGFLLQNPEHQIVTDKVWHELAFGLENLGYKQETIRLRVAEMAEYFGITDWYYESVEKLSGGQKQLMNLAAVMAMHPKVMILDEPTAQLDPIAAENFLDTLKKINRDLGITVILSEHRLNHILPMANRVVVMKKGEVLLSDSPQNVAEKITDKELIRLMPVPAQIFKSSGKEGCVPLSVEQGRKWINSTEVQGEIVSENREEKSELAISVKNLWFRYERSGRDIIKGLNLQVKKGEIFAILGGNGTGKTTTLSLLSGIHKAYRGKTILKGTVSALPQNVQTLFQKESVRKETESVPENIIKKMGLEELLEFHPYDISGGQQQKLALAKVLAAKPDILLLDEPTKAIDAIYKEELGEILKNLKAEGKTIVMVSHDVDFCGEYADRCGLFANGSLIAVNNFREFFAANRFYTTTVNKMAGHKIKNAVKKEDVVCFLTKENTISQLY
jgi:energy-coupling factor transport system ATP-binding protein